METYRVDYIIHNLSGLGFMHFYVRLDDNSDISIQDQAYKHVYYNCQMYKQKLFRESISVLKVNT